MTTNRELAETIADATGMPFAEAFWSVVEINARAEEAQATLRDLIGIRAEADILASAFGDVARILGA